MTYSLSSLLRPRARICETFLRACFVATVRALPLRATAVSLNSLLIHMRIETVIPDMDHNPLDLIKGKKRRKGKEKKSPPSTLPTKLPTWSSHLRNRHNHLCSSLNQILGFILNSFLCLMRSPNAIHQHSMLFC